MAATPQVNRRIVEALLAHKLPGAGGRRLMLVHGQYDTASPAEFAVTIADTSRRVCVTDQPSVLGIVEAWQQHRQACPDGDDVLVVTTGVDDAQLGWDLRAYAVERGTTSVDRADVVKQRFGATDIDPRIRRQAWLIDALLDAEPASGWRRGGSVLTLDTAVRALIGARLGRAELGEGSLDMGALLAWSLQPGGPDRFAELPAVEQAGLTAWLTEAVGEAAAVLLGLASAGRAADAMALGVVGTVTTEAGDSRDTGIAYGALLGMRVSGTQLRAFIEAVEGTLERLLAEAENGGTLADQARQRVLAVVRRADELATDTELANALAGNRFVPSGLHARLRALAGELRATPTARSVAAAEAALHGVHRHYLANLYRERVETAEMAVRLQRWLVTPAGSVDSVAAGVRAHLAEWGWVDRALGALWLGDPAADVAVGQAYHAVYEAAAARRDTLDEAFAGRLASWTGQASTHGSSGCLLIEDLLREVALPLAGERAPLVLVLDGMSSAVATQLGEQLAGRGWIEASAEAGSRRAAVAAIPSVTTVSRASLLTGQATVGDQNAEKDGFAGLWRKHHREGALFHKGQLPGRAGHRLAEELVTALAGDDAVGVVLNTIDDALDHGREGDRVDWRLGDITYLTELLDAARSYRRPVLLVADHGHVLERSPSGEGPTSADGVESARWRTGTAQPGEVELAGPRVLRGGGRIVAPWRANLRYTLRKSGYHGGASLAEMTVPVLVLLPSADLLPKGWSVLPPESIAPSWWVRRRTEEPLPTRAPAKAKATRRDTDATPLFEVAAASTETLGARVVGTEVYAEQRKFVPRAPNKTDIAAVIDALANADGNLSLTAVAAAGGRAGRSPEGFATTLQRLLNVEGYDVLSIKDSGRTLSLNLDLLRTQFRISA